MFGFVVKLIVVDELIVEIVCVLCFGIDEVVCKMVFL